MERRSTRSRSRLAGHDLVSGAIDGSLLVTRDGRDAVALPASPGGIDSAGFLPDGRVAAVDVHCHLRVIDPDRGGVLADLAVPTRVRLLRPSPDGRSRITIPSNTGKTASPVLWDLVHYRLSTEFQGHVERVFSARFVEAGQGIVTTGVDGTARLWDEGGRLRRIFRGSLRFLVDATLNPDRSIGRGRRW
jgi:WD40 repeat protein